MKRRNKNIESKSETFLGEWQPLLGFQIPLGYFLNFISEKKKRYMNCSPDHCIYVMVDIDHGLINPKSNFIQIHLDINSKAI